jgi:intracellular multiplication protein IcmS
MELIEQLTLVIRKMPVKFGLKGAQMSYEEMLSPTGLLPGIAKRADQLASLCLGYGLGIKVEDEEKSLMGVTVAFDEFTPNVIRIFCIVDILNDIVKMSASNNLVDLDELLYD